MNITFAIVLILGENSMFACGILLNCNTKYIFCSYILNLGGILGTHSTKIHLVKVKSTPVFVTYLMSASTSKR